MLANGDYGKNGEKSKYMLDIKNRITAYEKIDHYQSGRTLPTFLLFN